MNRIEKAIARAKAQKDTRSDTGIRHYIPPIPDSVAAPARHAAVAPEIDLGALRAVHFDPDALFASRIVAQSAGSGGPGYVQTRRDAGIAAFKMLRTRVMQRMQSKGWRRLAISSLLPGDGKSITALNLAISIARDPNLKCVLVDLDLRRPSIASYLGLPLQFGIESYLVGERQLEEVILGTSIPGFYVAPAAHSLENSSEVISSASSQAMLQKLGSLGDSTYCIFDLPPMLQADDLLAFAPMVDAVLLVVSEGQTSRDELARARELLNELNLLGVVLNRSKERMEAYGY